MALSLQLRLDERTHDRVFVSVLLAPTDDTASVDGVAVELQSAGGEALSHRMMLPISGMLAGPLATRVEVRSFDKVPRGSTVVATAWWAREQLEVRCPTDPATRLENHLRGLRAVPLRLEQPEEPRRLTEGELHLLTEALPWVRTFRASDEVIDDDYDASAILDPDIADTDEEALESLCSKLGLDEDCAQWLRDLLAEDEE